ncbi:MULTISPECIES: DUF333 domain-containing protein [unclassified Moraxella]|uniref:putative hemolysin n=1 Tax=unclassified Moraxella TaxID=2685852 RepID=UPI003AF51B4F
MRDIATTDTANRQSRWVFYLKNSLSALAMLLLVGCQSQSSMLTNNFSSSQSSLLSRTNTNDANENSGGRDSVTANPARAYCSKTGGISLIRQDKQGKNYVICQLSNGDEVDEWQYYNQAYKHSRKN